MRMRMHSYSVHSLMCGRACVDAATGVLQKKGTSGLHRWQERYFAFNGQQHARSAVIVPSVALLLLTRSCSVPLLIVVIPSGNVMSYWRQKREVGKERPNGQKRASSS